MQQLTDVFVDPDSFFASKTTEGRFRDALLVVVVAGLANALSGLATASQLLEAAGEGAGRFLIVGQLFGAILGVVGIFVMWIVFAGLFHLISRFFDGSGEFRDVVTLTGYGFVPWIFFGLISGVINFYAYQGVVFPSDPQQIPTFMQQLQSRPIFLVSGVLSIVFSLWRGFLWTFAVKHARDLSLKHAAITVGIPVGVSIAWGLFNLL